MFHSTRGKKLISGSEAIIKGLADDGGLFVMDDLSKIDYHDFLDKSYEELTASIIKAFFDEFDYDIVLKEVKEGYKSFDTKNVIELKKCNDFYFLELFHGPTLAFKDLALSIMPRLMKMAKDKLNIKDKITILTATSGDTGSAALNGFKNIEGINIIVLYPNGGVSNNQEKLMLNYQGGNAHVIAVDGNFDDCQTFLKKFIAGNPNLNISTANSINIARLVLQIVYYYESYIRLLNNNDIKEDEEVSFIVPTGNFGDILAGFLAKKMGLPIKNLICASNKNDVLTEYFNTGKYNRNREFYKTNSPSMDILTSSNFERFLYYASNNDTVVVSNLMNDLKEKGYYEFKNPFDYFYGYKTDDLETLKYIKEVYDKYNYLIDPHTSCGYGAYMKYNNQTNEKKIILSTASIFKFPDTILKAFNKNGDINDINELFNIEIPESLRFKNNEKEIVNLKDLDNYLHKIIEVK